MQYNGMNGMNCFLRFYTISFMQIIQSADMVSTHLQVACCVEQQVARLEISVQYVSRVDVLESTEDLVEEVADMVVAQPLCFQQLVHVCFHEGLYNVAGGYC